VDREFNNTRTVW